MTDQPEPMRKIVSTPDTLEGRWRLDGTRISVDQLKRLIRHEETEGPGYIERNFPHLHLTAEERAAIKAWTFPALYDHAIIDTEADTRFRCRCGEWMGTPLAYDVTHVTITCDACGRRYTLTLTEVIPDDH